MKLSFYCKHCGLHNKKADHRECKKILRRQHAAEAERLATAARTQAQYARDKTGQAEFLAKLDESGYYPASND